MFVLVNLKAYAVDPTAVAVATRRVADESGVRVAVCPQAVHLDTVAETGAETWAQHVAPVGPGSQTGSTLAGAVADAGAAGTLLNHSERRLASLGPDAVALEPPELIGSGTPVSSADPEVVEDAVAAVETVAPGVETFCGAGIATGDDVAAAADLGTTGVLVASGVAKADDPEAALWDLVAGV
jgi:triosephosphate isomerase